MVPIGDMIERCIGGELPTQRGWFNDARLKRAGGGNYFDELLARINRIVNAYLEFAKAEREYERLSKPRAMMPTRGRRLGWLDVSRAARASASAKRSSCLLPWCRRRRR